MERYIDADALMEVLERSAKDPRNETAMTSWANAFQELIVLLEETLIPMSIADVVEVVRCKDCKWYGIDELKKDGSLDRRYKPSVCYLFREHHEESWFCADAERREE